MLDKNIWWKRLWRMDAALLLVAATAGIAGAILCGKFLGARAAATEASLRSRYDSRAVVVAAADLAPGDPLDVSRLAVRNMPKEFLPADAVPAERAAELIGGRMTIAVRRGTAVVAAAVSRGSQSQRLSDILSGDRRALTIPVDQVNSQAGNLQPGDHVDLYYSRSHDGDAILMPLLQRIEVLAAGSAMMSPGDSIETDPGFSTITLGLTTAEAARVLLAQQSGSLSVVLRSASDTAPVATGLLHARDLLRQQPRALRNPAENRVELLTGGNGELAPVRSWLPGSTEKAIQSGDAS